ncbi:MAG: hypothetical protein P1V34_19050 [Alphaproteobacteria bacterium]|nr:hypothetical protein [Alphaproteobacteria bacterium]
MGYLTEAIAIRHRARRCRADWQPHQANTKAAILSAAHAYGPLPEITILGAGLCLDVPVDELSHLTDRLTLIDAVRLRGIRLPKNVRYLCMDVEGSAVALHSGKLASETPLADFDGPGLIVSVNLLSQLPLIPNRWSDDTALNQRIVHRHVQSLRDHKGPTLLIADAVRWTLDMKGAVLLQEDIAQSAGLPSPEQTWRWPIIPAHEAGKGPRIESDVGVWWL